MKREKAPSGPCGETLEALQTEWLNGPRGRDRNERGLPGRRLPDHGPAATHLAACPECRSVADEIDLLDRQIAVGFLHLRSLVKDPSEETVDELIRRIREDDADSKLIRRIRRPIRILLWITFYSFTLLACLLLAAAVYRALG
jgi:hypothetical protein